jgi:4'-phosphopantetheinyl transferase
MMEMNGDEAHVWTVEATSADPRFLEVLSAAERERMERFRFERDRLSYLAAHGLARFALSACAPGIAPQDWQFAYGERGKPEIIGAPLRFNISHTHGLAGCVVTRDIDCGIDVETTHRRAGIQRLAGRVLSPAERAALNGAPHDEQPRLFFTFWTLKEAYVKARGCGISIPLDRCSFDADLALADDDPRDWQFERWAATDQHLVAVALRSGGRTRRIIRHDAHSDTELSSGCGSISS